MTIHPHGPDCCEVDGMTILVRYTFKDGEALHDFEYATSQGCMLDWTTDQDALTVTFRSDEQGKDTDVECFEGCLVQGAQSVLDGECGDWAEETGVVKLELELGGMRTERIF